MTSGVVLSAEDAAVVRAVLTAARHVSTHGYAVGGEALDEAVMEHDAAGRPLANERSE